MSYFYQIVVARKFSKALSFQVSPILVHKNLVVSTQDKNDIWALALGGRWKFSRSVALTAEYTFRLNKYATNYAEYHNSAGIGVDIETGGHVFQVFITNSQPISELQFISDTRSSWTKGDIRLGFNMSRVFAL
jgi:adenosine/AMP kinase